VKAQVGQPGEEGYEEGMYPEATPTPYMHAMLAHLGTMLRRCRSLDVPLKLLSTQVNRTKNTVRIKLARRTLLDLYRAWSTPTTCTKNFIIVAPCTEEVARKKAK
jgi:hypothetical protein